MADIKKTIEIIFGGRNELSEAVTGVVRDMQAFEKSVSSVANQLASAGDAILKIDAALVAMVVGGMAMAISKSSEFSGSFKEITTLTDASAADMGKFREQVIEYAQGSSKSIADIEQSLYKAISAGVKYEDALGTLGTAEKLAIAGRNDLASTTVLLAGTMNAYGAKTDEVTRYSDVFMQTVRQGLTTLPELAQSFSTVAGVAALGKIPIETMGAAIAALTATGLETQPAITGLRAVISKIIEPSKQASDLAEQLGINWNAEALQVDGLQSVLKKAYEATAGNSEQMAILLGGIRGLNAGMILAQDASGNFAKSLKSMGEAAGVTAEAYAKMADSLKLSTQNMKNNFDVMWIAIGYRFTSAEIDMNKALGGLFKSIRDAVNEGAFNDLFKVFNGLHEEAAAFVTQLAHDFPSAISTVDFSPIAKAIKGVQDKMTSLFSDTTPAEGMAKAIQLIVDTVGSLITVTAGMAEPFLPLINCAIIALEAFNRLDDGTKSLAGNIIGLSMAFKLFGPLGLVIMALGTDTETATSVINISFMAIENGVNAVRVAFASLGMVAANIYDDILKVLSYIPGSSVTATDLENSAQRIQVIGQYLNESEDKLAISSMKLNDAMFGAGDTIDKTKTKTSALAEAVKGIPDSKSVSVGWDEAKTAEMVAGLNKYIGTVPDNSIKKVTATAEADETSYKQVVKLISDTLPDGTVTISQVIVDVPVLAATKKAIDEATPAEKKIEATLETAKIKEQAATVQKALEWSAKVDIAQIESATKTVQSMFSSIDNSIKSTGDVMSDEFKALTQTGPYQYFIKTQIEAEEKRREEAFDLQKTLIDGQVKLLEMKVKALESGDTLINVKADGLQPHLEAIMWEILKACQIRATESAAEFLIGIGT